LIISLAQPPRRLITLRLTDVWLSSGDVRVENKRIRNSAGDAWSAALQGRNRIFQLLPSLLATCRRLICFSLIFPGHASTALQLFDARAFSRTHKVSFAVFGLTTRTEVRSIPAFSSAGG